MRRRSTPFRTMLLAFVASLVFVFGMVLSTGTVSAHTASTQFRHPGHGEFFPSEEFFPGFAFPQCGGIGEFQFFDQCGIGNGCCFSPCVEFGCGLNNCNSFEPFLGGDQFSSFGNCNFFFPSEFNHHHHHRHLFCFTRHHHRVCV